MRLSYLPGGYLAIRDGVVHPRLGHVLPRAKKPRNPPRKRGCERDGPAPHLPMEAATQGVGAERHALPDLSAALGEERAAADAMERNRRPHHPGDPRWPSVRAEQPSRCPLGLQLQTRTPAATAPAGSAHPGSRCRARTLKSGLHRAGGRRQSSRGRARTSATATTLGGAPAPTRT